MSDKYHAEKLFYRIHDRCDAEQMVERIKDAFKEIREDAFKAGLKHAAGEIYQRYMMLENPPYRRPLEREKFAAKKLRECAKAIRCSNSGKNSGISNKIIKNN